MKKLRKWREYLTERLAANREETNSFLEAVMEEFHIYKNSAALLGAIRVVVEAQGGITELAKRTHMSPDALQKILSSDKAPHIDTLGTILNALGCRLSIVPIEAEKPCSEIVTEN
jgi:DNA-binding phage protein